MGMPQFSFHLIYETHIYPFKLAKIALHSPWTSNTLIISNFKMTKSSTESRLEFLRDYEARIPVISKSIEI